jgi:hypothetical protein
METKICGKCKREKPLSEFYPHKRDGHQSHCKECKREEGKIYNRQPKRRIYNAKYAQQLKDNGYFKEYQNRPEVKRQRADRAKRYCRDPRLRIRWMARWYTKRMVRNGKIQQQPCAVCGKAESEIHHPDYNQPLLIVWLCPQCHRELHKNAKAEGK